MAHQAAALAPAAGRYVAANGLRIYCEETGAGRPLLLIHGGALNLNMWAPHMPVFGRHFRVIAFDSRGHGRTSNPLDTMTYRMLADDTVALIHALQLERPLICGMSDGGQIALEMGIHYPHLAQAYVVNGATYRWSAAYPAWAKRLGLQSPGTVDIEQVQRAAPQMVEFLQKHQDAYQGEGYWQSYLRQASYMWLPPLAFTNDDLQRMVDPTLVFAGDRDELAIPVEDAVHLYRSLPHAELAIAPGSEHMFPVNNPHLFTQLALDFLLRHQTGSTPA